MNEVYENRRKKLKIYLEEQQIDVAIITSPASVFYYSGFNSDPHERFMAVVIDMIKGETVLFVPLLDESAAAIESDITTIFPISDEEDPFEIVSNKIGSGKSKFGVEMKAFSLFRYNSLKEFYPHSSFNNIEAAVNFQCKVSNYAK